MAPLQGRDNTSALESDFHSLKAELDELSAALHRPEHSSTAQAQFDTSKRFMQQAAYTSSTTQPHAAYQEGPFSSSNQRWRLTTDGMSDSYIKPRQHAPHHGTASAGVNTDHENVQEPAGDMYHQQRRHSQSDLTASPAQLYDGQDYRQTEGTEGGQGPTRSSRGHDPSPQSVLGCSSVRSLPVLNNSFIVPAQAVKPRKVDRVTRYR